MLWQWFNVLLRTTCRHNQVKKNITADEKSKTTDMNNRKGKLYSSFKSKMPWNCIQKSYFYQLICNLNTSHRLWFHVRLQVRLHLSPDLTLHQVVTCCPGWSWRWLISTKPPRLRQWRRKWMKPHNQPGLMWAQIWLQIIMNSFILDNELLIFPQNLLPSIPPKHDSSLL